VNSLEGTTPRLRRYSLAAEPPSWIDDSSRTLQILLAMGLGIRLMTPALEVGRLLAYPASVWRHHILYPKVQ
jgi:hypothetical protein